MRKDNRGSILLSVVFLSFIFFAGFGLVTFTITHARIAGARTMKLRHVAPMHQDLIYYLHHFREEVFSNEFRDYPVEEYFCVEKFPSPPLSASGSRIDTGFKYSEFPRDAYKRTRVMVMVDVTDGKTLLRNNYHLKAETSIDVLSGRIPLDYIPFFFHGNIETPEEEFFRGNKIINQGKGQLVAGDFPVQLDFKGWLRDTLKIPDNSILFWRNIREKLGLEPGDGPIDEGIYLMVEEESVPAVFVQGDVEQLTFFVVPSGSAVSIQGIRFLIKSQLYEIRYKPGERWFELSDPPIKDVPGDLVFREQIIVNGNVGSIRQEGEAAFSGYTNIMLYVAGKSYIDSDLATESYHLNLEEVRVTHLTLSNGLEQLYGIGYGLEEKGVTVNPEGETNLDIAVVTEGKFTNKSKKLKLKGRLFCKGMENGGEIHIKHRGTRSDNRYFSTVDFKFIRQFLVESIEEVSDE